MITNVKEIHFVTTTSEQNIKNITVRFVIRKFPIQWNCYSVRQNSISSRKKTEIRDIKLQDHKKAIQEDEVDKVIGDAEFKCSKCKRVVSINDTLDRNIEDNKKTCKHCAILQYDYK